jgi:hypothetical protein
VYVRDWHPPSVELAEIPGRWRQEQALPPDRAELRTWFCGPEGALSASPPAASARSLRCVPSAGIAAGNWWGELTTDQRGADAWSLTFDSPPLETDTEILGFPRVELYGSTEPGPDDAGAESIRPDNTRALPWFARLSDVAPDGTVTLVTGAGRAGVRDPLRDPPVAGPAPAAEGALPLDLHVTSWVFPRGHRIRLAVSSALWPMIWPAPQPGESTLRFGADGTRLVLPVIPPAEAELPVPRFPEPGPEDLPEGVRHWGEIVPVRWSVHRDEAGTVSVSWRGTSGSEFPWGRIVDEEYLRYEVHDDRPAQAAAHGEARTEVHLDGRLLVTTSTLDLDGDEASLHYRFRRELRSDGILIRERHWDRRFPRHPW